MYGSQRAIFHNALAMNHEPGRKEQHETVLPRSTAETANEMMSPVWMGDLFKSIGLFQVSLRNIEWI